MTNFLFGLLMGFVIGYGLGLYIDKLDKRIKHGEQLKEHTRTNK